MLERMSATRYPNVSFYTDWLEVPDQKVDQGKDGSIAWKKIVKNWSIL